MGGVLLLQFIKKTYMLLRMPPSLINAYVYRAAKIIEKVFSIAWNKWLMWEGARCLSHFWRAAGEHTDMGSLYVY